MLVFWDLISEVCTEIERKTSERKEKRSKGSIFGIVDTGGLVGWFYGISTIVGYLVPNSFLFV